jgi:predicted PurR-regulated permease PerM
LLAVLLGVYLRAIADTPRPVHLIEANFIPPVLTIAGVLLLGKLFGLAGLVAAVPILAVIIVLIRHVLLGGLYGDAASAVQPAHAVRPLNP